MKIEKEGLPDNFRNRFSKESYASGSDITNIAEARGHTLEVHLQNYSIFKPSEPTELYHNRNKQMV